MQSCTGETPVFPHDVEINILEYFPTERAPFMCSNRSAALLQLRKSGKALEDAEQCIKRKPDWDKGFYRKGLALELAGRCSEVRASSLTLPAFLKRMCAS